jgi:hypothetical protein
LEIEFVGEEPVFETGLLLAGDLGPAEARRQLYRWTRAGRIYRLRRDLYALAPPFQKVKPHPLLVANRTARGSYVSRQSALARYGFIPEYVPVPLTADMADEYLGPILEAAQAGDLSLIRNVP